MKEHHSDHDDQDNHDHHATGTPARPPLNKVTHARVTPNGLRVSFSACKPKRARNCGFSQHLLGTCVSRKSAILERGHLEWGSLCVLQWF